MLRFPVVQPPGSEGRGRIAGNRADERLFSRNELPSALVDRARLAQVAFGVLQVVGRQAQLTDPEGDANPSSGEHMTLLDVDGQIRMVGNQDDASDLAQRALVKGYQKLSSCREPEFTLFRFATSNGRGKQ